MKISGLYISRRVQEKLDAKHGGISIDEIQQCFANRDGAFLRDTRAEHMTDPVSQWFIAETDRGRELKIVFMNKNGDLHIKTAYEPNEDERTIYEKVSK